MATYYVHFQNTVSTTIEIEWDGDEPPTADDLEELATNSDDMPGSITVGAFGGGMSTSVDDGQWFMASYEDPDGKEIEV